jgi:hypothetical protein
MILYVRFLVKKSQYTYLISFVPNCLRSRRRCRSKKFQFEVVQSSVNNLSRAGRLALLLALDVRLDLRGQANVPMRGCPLCPCGMVHNAHIYETHPPKKQPAGFQLIKSRQYFFRIAPFLLSLAVQPSIIVSFPHILPGGLLIFFLCFRCSRGCISMVKDVASSYLVKWPLYLTQFVHVAMSYTKSGKLQMTM